MYICIYIYVCVCLFTHSFYIKSSGIYVYVAGLAQLDQLVPGPSSLHVSAPLGLRRFVMGLAELGF